MKKSRRELFEDFLKEYEKLVRKHEICIKSIGYDAFSDLVKISGDKNISKHITGIAEENCIKLSIKEKNK